MQDVFPRDPPRGQESRKVILSEYRSVREGLDFLNDHPECTEPAYYVWSNNRHAWYCISKKPGVAQQALDDDVHQIQRAISPEVAAQSVPSVENRLFVEWVMGGMARIDMLKRNLAEVRAMGPCMVLTNGFDSDVHAVLSLLGLQEFFGAICGTQPREYGGGAITFPDDQGGRVIYPGAVRYNKTMVMKDLLSHTPWVLEMLGEVDGLVYADDHVESAQGKVATVALPSEGTGLTEGHFKAIKDAANKLGTKNLLFIFDFDCTLSQYHLFKVMNQARSQWRRMWNNYLANDCNPPLPPNNDWTPGSRPMHMAERPASGFVSPVKPR